MVLDPTMLKQTLCLLSAFALPPALAQVSMGKEDGARLLARCEPAVRLLEVGTSADLTREEYGDARACIGFVDGFIWGHGWAAWRQTSPMYYCPPEGFSASQGLPAIVQYLRAHPDRLDADAHVLTFSALSDAYPCEPPPQGR